MSGGISQAAFTKALLDPDRPAPASLTSPSGAQAGKRFDVYRNNVAVSLTEALGVAFPVVRKLVGDEFFTAMAGVFLRAHPPKSPVLMLYGDQMPAFLEGFAPVRHLGYLPDVARLELQLREACHAADARPIAPDALAAIPPEDLASARFALAPATRILRSQWPVFSIWQANSEEGAPAPIMRGEDVLITRPGFDPAPQCLPAGDAAFIEALMAGASLGEALEKAGGDTAGFDLAATLALLLEGGAITSILTRDSET